MSKKKKKGFLSNLPSMVWALTIAGIFLASSFIILASFKSSLNNTTQATAVTALTNVETGMGTLSSNFSLLAVIVLVSIIIVAIGGLYYGGAVGGGRGRA